MQVEAGDMRLQAEVSGFRVGSKEQSETRTKVTWPQVWHAWFQPLRGLASCLPGPSAFLCPLKFSFVLQPIQGGKDCNQGEESSKTPTLALAQAPPTDQSEWTNWTNQQGGGVVGGNSLVAGAGEVRWEGAGGGAGRRRSGR